jgi:phosphoribosylamine--glycine ligase
MKILVLGPNSTADFISQKLLEDDRVEKVWHFGANGNKLTTLRYKPFPINKDFLLNFVQNPNRQIDLIIPTTLIFQLWKKFDEIVREKNIPILMPSYGLGDLEWSKHAGKQLLTMLGIPTPHFRKVHRSELIKDFYHLPRPYVIKYEQDSRFGLQTIIINDSTIDTEFATIINAQESAMRKNLKKSDEETPFIIEDYVDGMQEYSYHAICNEKNWQYLGTARDYKKRYENDIGHNTISMGAYSPVENVDLQISSYVSKILEFLKSKETPFVGILYLGIMIDKTGTPQVLEINTRPGSPEIETIIPTIDTNLLDIFSSTALNNEIPEIKFNNQHVVSLRIVNKDYTEQVATSKVSFILPDLPPTVENITVSKGSQNKLWHSVLTISDKNRNVAASKLYQFLENKSMGDFTFRTDIGFLK